MINRYFVPDFTYGTTYAFYMKGRDNMKKEKKAKFEIGDVVRILDGSKIKKFYGGYIKDMANRIGEVHTISSVVESTCYETHGYRFFELDYVWDERCLEKVEETYTVTVSGNKIVVTDGDGNHGEARCSKEDEFNLAKGVALAFERMAEDKDAIKEGDWVEVTDPGMGYTTYSTWVVDNINDKKQIADYKYGSPARKYLEGKVLKIAKHGTWDETLAYISGPDGCYLLNVNGLKKVKR